MSLAYDPALLTLSAGLAVLTAWTAIDLAGRTAASAGPLRAFWLLGGAVALGVGLWGAHFVGMLAFRLPVPATYDLGRVLLSAVVAITAATLALAVMSRDGGRAPFRLAAAGLLGLLVAAMHHIGMSALYAPVRVRVAPGLVATSVAIAIAAAYSAVTVVPRYRRPGRRRGINRKGAGAALIGLALSAAHFTAMASATLTPVATELRVPSGYLLATSALALAVVIGTLVVLGLTLLGVRIDRRMRARLAEHELVRRSEERLRRFHEALSFGVIVQDPAGRVVHANQAACALLGLTPAQLLGQAPRPAGWLLLREDGRPDPPDEDPISLARRTREPVRGAVRAVRADGRPERWILIDAVPVFEAGTTQLVEAIGSFTDITARREAEAALRASEDELRHAQKMEAVGRLAGGIAHDFNNQLTAILGFTNLVLGDTPPDHPHYQELEEVRGAAERAASLTRHLLAYSRKQILRPRALDLNAVVQDLDNMLRRLIGEHIELRTALAPELGQVRADRSQLEQVLMNLVVNARDAMPEGGRLTIETAQVHLDEHAARAHYGLSPGTYVMLAVSDTGIGMDAETRSRIFEPFFTTKPVGQGTGLGLSTVHGIVEQSGGHIWVESESGRGTTFKVLLPRVPPGRTSRAEQEVTDLPEFGSETVLLVEDEDGVRRLAREVLERRGYRVLEARDPASALAEASRHGGPIHLLITDLVMPGGSGGELARALARARPEIRHLYISGYTESLGPGGELGPDVAFLQKPFTPSALARKVREVLDLPAEVDLPMSSGAGGS